MARPVKDDKKVAVSIKLPPYLIEWMDQRPESRAVLIETALCVFYKIPGPLNPAKPKKNKIHS